MNQVLHAKKASKALNDVRAMLSDLYDPIVIEAFLRDNHQILPGTHKVLIRNSRKVAIRKLQAALAARPADSGESHGSPEDCSWTGYNEGLSAAIKILGGDPSEVAPGDAHRLLPSVEPEITDSDDEDGAEPETV